MADVKDLNYYKSNCAEDYVGTPISVLRYISELEDTVELLQTGAIKQSEELFCVDHPYENTYISITGAIVCVECLHVIKK